MYTLEGTVVIQSSGKFVRMLILIISRSSSKLGHVRSKTRSLDQILEKLCVHSGVHSFVSNVMTFVRMLIIIISRSSLKLGHVGSKTRLLGQQATQVSDLGPLWPSCYNIYGTKIFLGRNEVSSHIVIWATCINIC